MKTKIKQILNNKFFEKTILLLIVFSLIVFILDSMQGFHLLFNRYIKMFEAFTIIVFTFEYLCRLIVINKLSDIFKPYMIIDLFAILPFYLSYTSVNTVFLRMFRFSRFLRVLKIGRYSKAFDNIVQGFKSKKEELIITFTIFAVGVLLTAILMYLAENEVQPQVFSSIPKCLYFSVITFTTIGYGDVTPITTLGKVVACMCAVFGVGLHGLFIGIIGSAFIQAFRKD